MKSIQSIEAANRHLLTQLQEILGELVPILSSNSNADILAVVLDYAQGIYWNLKNTDEETIIDILAKKASVTKESENFEAITKMLKRHRRLGGWYQTPAYTSAPTKAARDLQESVIEAKLKAENAD